MPQWLFLMKIVTKLFSNVSTSEMISQLKVDDESKMSTSVQIFSIYMTNNNYFCTASVPASLK